MVFSSLRYWLVVFSFLLVFGCKHGIDIVGDGDVSSSTGGRDCSKQEAPCEFVVSDAYIETYTANPSPGWLFDSWDVCPTTNGNDCSFTIPADIVEQYPDLTLPPAVARFRLPIEPLFPANGDGTFQLPDTPAANEFAWFMRQLNAESTSVAEINAHFDANTLAGIPASEWQSFFDSLRQSVPNAQIVDLITVAPNRVRAVIGDPANPASGVVMTLKSSYPASSIISLGGSNFPQSATNTSVEDASLSLKQIASKFKAVADNTALLVAKIDGNQCKPTIARNVKKPQQTGSIFKIWVLGALAQAIDDGVINASDELTFVSSEVVVSSGINDIAPGTQIPLVDMAAFMMGNSDNTATDHIHERVGRSRLEAILTQFNNRNPSGLTPFLSLNEQFQVFWGLTPEEANEYATSGDNRQRNILLNTIEPLGVPTEFPYSNEDALRVSSWAASAMDVCQAYAGLRQFDNRSDAFSIIDFAFGAEAVLNTVRNKWDRVWSKGGSLVNENGNYVFTLSWLLESDTRGAHVIVLMANNEDRSAIVGAPIFSMASRIAEILDETN